MGLSQALFSAISGLVNHQKAMDNIGNNLANVNTVAFKKGVFQFRTLLEQTLQGGTAADPNTGRGPINPIAIGLGTQTGSINKVFSQGPLEVTGNSRDMAIDGNGYFVLRQGTGNVYTRDGTFYLGSEGELLGSNGLQVQGVAAENGVIPTGGVQSDLTIPIGETGGARETTEIGFSGNLNSDQEVATGLKLVTALPAETGGADDYQPLYDYLGNVTSTDTTWLALGNGPYQMINGGTVETTSALAVANPTGSTTPPYVAANLGTDLADLHYLSGTTFVRPFDGISNGDEIEITFRKGGRRHTATFTYNNGTGDPNQPDSYTLEQFASFLSGGVDNSTNVTNLTTIQNDQENLVGGAMGTVKIIGKVSTAHTMLDDLDDDGTADVTYSGTSAYDVPPETAGAFSRSYAAAVDYDSDGVNDGDSFNLSIVSNLGAENAISDIEVSFQNVNYTDIFTPDRDYSAVQGGSATTNMIVYDSLGNPKTITMQMSLVDRDTNFSTWRWVADSDADTDADYQYADTLSTTRYTETGDQLQQMNSLNITASPSAASGYSGSLYTSIVDTGGGNFEVQIFSDTARTNQIGVSAATFTNDVTGLVLNQVGGSGLAGTINVVRPGLTFVDDTNITYTEIPGGASMTTSTNVGTGSIRFDSEGRFVVGGELSETAGLQLTLEDQGVNNPLQVTLQEGLATGSDQDLDFSALTQVKAASDFNLKEQDGTAPGTLDQFSVTADGVIQGVFSNGVVEALGRLSLALVPNENGLIHAGSNLFYEGPSSGAARIDFAGVGGRGSVRAGQLETSNVDLSEEFTKLITTERGFQANARVISTSDEMLVELVNLKR